MPVYVTVLSLLMQWLPGSNATALVNCTNDFFLCHTTLKRRFGLDDKLYNLGSFCRILFSTLLREGIGCSVVTLLSGTGFLILSSKVAVEKDRNVFVSSSRRIFACFTAVIRLGEELRVWCPSAQVTSTFIEHGHTWGCFKKTAWHLSSWTTLSCWMLLCLQWDRISARIFESISGHLQPEADLAVFLFSNVCFMQSFTVPCK